MLRGKVQPFKLQAEEVSRSSIRYLDLLLTKTGTRFVARPAFKTTSLARPFDPTSAHPKFVHRSWPVGMVKRIFPFCSRDADVLPCKEELISRLQANSASKCTIARVVKVSRGQRGRFHVFLMFLLFCGAAFGFHLGLQRELSHAFCRVFGERLLCICP